MYNTITFEKEEPMSERVNVKILLLVGGEAEVVADACWMRMCRPGTRRR
ncbi:hypothetical protein SCALM49S_04557 [Streptomyces californicus]